MNRSLLYFFRALCASAALGLILAGCSSHDASIPKPPPPQTPEQINQQIQQVQNSKMPDAQKTVILSSLRGHLQQGAPARH